MTGGVAIGGAGGVVLEMVAAINEHRAWLSEIDGAIGDGDHGINMSKGFTQAGAAIGDGNGGLSSAFETLGNTLLSDIGGSMGPLYGSFFLEMAATLEGAETLDAPLFSRMLHAGLASVEDLGGAKPGDKTMLDTLVPALAAFDARMAEGGSFADALAAMSSAAERGRDATKDMLARIGRAARLGDRSRGVVDAGAASCCLILQTLAAGLRTRGA
jgi:dihydroxyacetone kinase phosphoprotein-dependent L subunit